MGSRRSILASKPTNSDCNSRASRGVLRRSMSVMQWVGQRYHSSSTPQPNQPKSLPPPGSSLVGSPTPPASAAVGEESDRSPVRGRAAPVPVATPANQLVIESANLGVAVLGIPLEYDYRDVDQELERWGVCFNKLIWRTEDNMEYLEINLKSIRDLRNLDSFRRIRSYPVMVLKNPRSTSLLSMLRDYQVKVDVRGKI